MNDQIIQKIQEARSQGQTADLTGIDLRIEHFQNADLSGVDWSEANLSGTEFLACNLAHCKFRRANLSGCKFTDIDLSGADLSEATLGGADLSNCKLVNCNLYRANLSGCNLHACDLTGANLVEVILNTASFPQANFHGAGLVRAGLNGAGLAGSDFSEADLSGADLQSAQLCHCNLTKAALRQANLGQCNLAASDLSGADLTEAVLDQADLSSATLRGAALVSAGLRYANLSNAVLTAANLSKARLEHAVMNSTDLTGADVRGANFTAAYSQDNWGIMTALDYPGPTPPTFRGALYDDETLWGSAARFMNQATKLDRPALPLPAAHIYQPVSGETFVPQQNGCLHLLAPILRLIAPEAFPPYTLPTAYLKTDERAVGDRAYQLLLEVNEALKHNRRISPERKASLKQQGRQIQDNVVTLLWKLARIRKAKVVVKPQFQAELEKLETRLWAEITHSSDILEDVLMSTLQLEIRGGDKTLDRLLEDLNESNKRMRDLADAYDEVKRKTY